MVDCSLKPTLALKPEARAKWLTKAVSALRDGAIRVSDVFDIIAHPKFVNGIPEGIGKKMRRSLSGEMKLFSDKQRQGLERSELFKRFPEEAKPSKAQPAEVDEGKMDEMMARCRAFVKDNETLYEVRKREVEEAEDKVRREEEERLRAIEDEKRRILEELSRQEDEAQRKNDEEKRRAEEDNEDSDEASDEEEGATDALAKLERDLQEVEASPPEKPKEPQVESHRSREREPKQEERVQERGEERARKRSRSRRAEREPERRDEPRRAHSDGQRHGRDSRPDSRKVESSRREHVDSGRKERRGGRSRSASRGRRR